MDQQDPLLDFEALNTPPSSRYMSVYGTIPEGYKIGGTGHRPDRHLDVYRLAAAKPAMQVIKTKLMEMATPVLDADSSQRIIVMSGMGPGFDQWLAAATLWLKKEGYPFELWMIIPWKGFEWPRYWAENRRWIADMMEKALKVSHLTDVEIRSTDHAAQTVMCHDRNEEVARLSQKALSSWSGAEAGGTWDTIKRMRSYGIEPENIYKDVCDALFGAKAPATPAT
jgi:uncharacterized phage-like protein YoqJ